MLHVAPDNEGETAVQGMEFSEVLAPDTLCTVSCIPYPGVKRNNDRCARVTYVGTPRTCLHCLLFCRL
jgi:hypothetical protein